MCQRRIDVLTQAENGGIKLFSLSSPSIHSIDSDIFLVKGCLDYGLHLYNLELLINLDKVCRSHTTQSSS